MEGTLQGALLAALLFGGYQASGLCLARLALPGEGPGVRLLVGSLWGSVLLQWLPALLAFAVGFTPLAQWLGLGLAWMLYALLWRWPPGRWRAAAAFPGRPLG